jgi:anti-sigma B factor antagonist
VTDPIADVEVERHGAIVVATLRGEVDLSNGSRLRDRILGESLAARAVVVDLRAVSYMDSAGLALLDGLAAELSVTGGHVLLVAPDDCPAHRVIVLSGLGVSMHADMETAIGEAQA